MKKIILSMVAVMATFFCASTLSAQGIKIYKQGGEVIDIPASELDRIEAYDAAAAGLSIEGTWKMKELVTTREFMNDAWYGMVTFNDAFPAFNTEDEITFQNGKLIPNLKSNLKNFFKGEATYELAESEYSFHPFGMATVTMQLLKVKGVNRNFDANNPSEDDEAYIGVRLVEDEDADEAGIYYLEVYLLDYKATSFAPEFNDYYVYGEEKPVANSSNASIVFSMEKKTSASRRRGPAARYSIVNNNGMIELLTHNYAIAFFYAPWCGPCLASLSNMETLVAQSNSTIGYGTVNEADSNSLFYTYDVNVLPTVILFHEGVEYDRVTGAITGNNYTKIANFINMANTLPFSTEETE